MADELPGTPLLSVKQAAAFLNVSESTIRRLKNAGTLQARRIGNQLRFDRRDLEQLSSEEVGTAESGGSTSVYVPEFGRSRVEHWREVLRALLPNIRHTHAVVIDRRGAKAFTWLCPAGFVWGKNLWHSTALDGFSDDQLLELFGDADLVVFDEMVQRGRELADVRSRLEALGLPVRTICLIRRRSLLLEGALLDPHVQPIEDLDEREFEEAAAFLSRLFDYCEPPLDPEHVVISCKLQEPLALEAAERRLADYGLVELVWNRQDPDSAAVSALTVDRPRFFDTTSVRFPAGITAEWDGPFKVRAYLSESGRRVTMSFITFPTLRGSAAAWRAAVGQTNARFGVGQSRSLATAAGEEFGAQDLERAYVDICTDVSIELLRQAGASGMLASIGCDNAKSPGENVLTGFFGLKRGREVRRHTREALSNGGDRNLALAVEPPAPVPLFVDSERTMVRYTDPASAHEAVIRQLPHRDPDTPRRRAAAVGLRYRDLLVATRPVDEMAISPALDGLLDSVRAKPINIVTETDDGFELARAFVGSEFDTNSTHDGREHRRAQAVAVAALSEWLRRLSKSDETEIHVAKLIVNTVHDWGRHFTPLAIQPYPHKHGFLPGVRASVPYRYDAPRYLIPELVDADLLRSTRSGGRGAFHYAPADGVDADRLLREAGLDGQERAHLKGLVKTYALIQERCKVPRPAGPGRTAVWEFSDPLVVLSSARNEQITYTCGLFEIGEWIATGRRLFRMLEALDARNERSERFARQVSGQSVLFAQAARFLFGKLSMYEALPALRSRLVGLFEEEELDYGDILLDSIDTEARFEMDYAVSPYPVGLLRWAVAIMRPFSSLVRQVLTEFGLEEDRRSTRDREALLDDGTVVARDASYYASQLIDAVASRSLSAEIGSIPPLVAASAGDHARERQAIERLGHVFEEVVGVLTATVKEIDEIDAELRRQDEHRRDLISVGQKLEALGSLKRPGAFVAAGDFYNFINIVDQIADLTQTPGATVARQLQDQIANTVESITADHAGIVPIVSADNCVLASNDADELLIAAEQIIAVIQAQVDSWERGFAALPYMRFGIDRVETDVQRALMKALRIGDGLGLPRGSLAMTDGVRNALSPLNADRCELYATNRFDEPIWIIREPGDTTDDAGTHP